MLNRVDGYVLDTFSAFDTLQMLTIPPLPPGTNAYATISLSFLDTLFASNSPDPTYAAAAFIDSWTVYQSDGTQSGPQGPPFPTFDQNSVTIENCATITFALFVERAWAIAQVNVFSF